MSSNKRSNAPQNWLSANSLQVTASASGQVQGQASGTVGQDFVLQISNSHLWSPDDPFLYDLEVVLVSNTGDQQVCAPCSPLRIKP